MGLSERMKIEVIVVVLLGMMWSTMQMTPSAQSDDFPVGNCWVTYKSCIEDHLNQTKTNPEFDSSSLSFNTSKFLCCPLLQDATQNDKSCFCNLDTYIHQNPAEGPNITMILSFCNLFRSLDSLDSFCSSVAQTPPVSSSTPSPKQAPAADSTPSSSSGNNTVIIAAAAASATILLLFTIGIIFYCKKKRSPATAYGTVKEDAVPNEPAHPYRPPPGQTASEEGIITPESLQYEFTVLKAATNNFSDDHKLGQGGFGAVYKGVLQTGQVIAVKRLSRSSGQGDKEFKNEAAFVAKLQHRNLVRLTGFCLAKEERLLVYEFMPNKSLDYILFDPKKQSQLDWPQRYNIIKGIARGMLYLHEDCPTRIIHRDLKAANVLLDGDMNPKITDFGMARIFQAEQSLLEASRIVGTCGYMAPEYMIHGQVSAKSDVYSFGVLVLEIVSGKRISAIIYQPEGGENLLSYAWKCFRDRKQLEFMDPTMKDSYSEDEIVRSMHIGLSSVQEDMKKRPNMEKVVHMFSSDSAVNSLSLPQYPAFLFGGGYNEQSTTSYSHSVPWSGSEPSMSEPSAR